MDNIKPFRPGMEPATDIERDLLRHVQQKMDEAKAEGFHPMGMVYVMFCDDDDGQSYTRTHWDLEHVDGMPAHAVTFAAGAMMRAAMSDE